MLKGAAAVVLIYLALVSIVKADDRLSSLRELLAPMRAVNHDDPDARGATPALTTAKHLTRDWIEQQLGAFTDIIDTQQVAVGFNQDLRKADLLCEAAQSSDDRCSEREPYWWDGTGYLRPLRIEKPYHDFLVVRTGMGILCGSDDSAYVYAWRGNHWHRVWQNEQPIEAGKYRPRYITGVRVSPPDNRSTHRLILSLEHEGWCSSNFYRVFYRLWGIADPLNDAAPKLLLDASQEAYIGMHEPPIEGSMGREDALIEYTVNSFDLDVFSYEVIRHYRTEGDRIARIDPIALEPRAFTEEWLRGRWAESASFTDPAGRARLESAHKQLGSHLSHAQYLGLPQRCRKDSELRQVGILSEEGHKSYFLLRWRPPYSFQMIDVRAEPRSDCNDSDDVVNSIKTLFPTQEWR